MVAIDQAFVDSFIDGNFGLSIAHENIQFTPSPFTPYVELVVNNNDIRGFSFNTSDITDGVFKAILRYPIGKSSIPAKEMADEIMDYYTIGSIIEYDGQKVCITRKTRAPGVPESGWYKLIVSLWYRAFLGR